MPCRSASSIRVPASQAPPSSFEHSAARARNPDIRSHSPPLSSWAWSQRNLERTESRSRVRVEIIPALRASSAFMRTAWAPGVISSAKALDSGSAAMPARLTK